MSGRPRYYYAELEFPREERIYDGAIHHSMETDFDFPDRVVLPDEKLFPNSLSTWTPPHQQEINYDIYLPGQQRVSNIYSQQNKS